MTKGQAKMTDNDGNCEVVGGHVFRMLSIQDVYAKIDRERKRFGSANEDGDRAAQVDALVNFFITAWHMTDWVWKLHEQQIRDRYNDQQLSREQFLEKAKQECPDLKVCDVIANAAKHGGKAHEIPGRPDVNTILYIEDQANYAVEETGVADKRWALRIVINGRSKNPYDVLNAVCLFWYKFSQDLSKRRLEN